MTPYLKLNTSEVTPIQGGTVCDGNSAEFRQMARIDIRAM